MQVYQLIAEGQIAGFGHSINFSTNVFSSHEQAMLRIPAFYMAVCKPGMIQFVPSKLKIRVQVLRLLPDRGETEINLKIST